MIASGARTTAARIFAVTTFAHIPACTLAATRADFFDELEPAHDRHQERDHGDRAVERTEHPALRRDVGHVYTDERCNSRHCRKKRNDGRHRLAARAATAGTGSTHRKKGGENARSLLLKEPAPVRLC